MSGDEAVPEGEDDGEEEDDDEDEGEGEGEDDDEMFFEPELENLDDEGPSGGAHTPGIIQPAPPHSIPTPTARETYDPRW